MPRHVMRRSRCEPTLRELLADPVIQAVMEADGVDRDGLEADLRETAQALRRRPMSWIRCRDTAPQCMALHG
jgi:hypothetical protein